MIIIELKIDIHDFHYISLCHTCNIITSFFFKAFTKKKKKKKKNNDSRIGCSTSINFEKKKQKNKLPERKRNRMAHQLHEYKGYDNITYNTYDNCNNYIGIRTVTQYLF